MGMLGKVSGGASTGNPSLLSNSAQVRDGPKLPVASHSEMLLWATCWLRKLRVHFHGAGAPDCGGIVKQCRLVECRVDDADGAQICRSIAQRNVVVGHLLVAQITCSFPRGWRTGLRRNCEAEPTGGMPGR